MAPGVERVVHEARLGEEHLIVGFDVEAAETDREQARPARVCLEVLVDVGGVHDACESYECRVAYEREIVDEHLERALAAAVVELCTGRVERPCSLCGSEVE